MPHNATAVANRIIEMADANSHDLTLTQLVRLTYFCQAWMLALHHRPLVRQLVEAWESGPAIRKVFQDFRKHGAEPVRRHWTTRRARLDPQEQHLVQQVYSRYGHLSGTRLSELSCENGTPWHRVWKVNRERSLIPHSLMRDHYSREAASE